MKFLQTFESFSLILEAKIDDIYDKYYKDIDRETFDLIVLADPTTIAKEGMIGRMGTYSKWLLSLYKVDKLLIEDLYKATNYLNIFNKVQNTLDIQDRNILKYKSLPELLDVINKVGGTGKVEDNDETYLIEDRYFINNGEAEVYHEDDKYLIVIPHTLEASQFYAYNPKAADGKSEWCTYYPERFKSYSGRGNLNIIIDKELLNTDDKYRRLQFHFESGSFMDINDNKLPREIKMLFYNIFNKKTYLLRYDFVYDFYDGRAEVRLDKLSGYIDLYGNEIIPCKYNVIHNFNNGRAKVEKDNKFGFVDLKGNEIIPVKYDDVLNFTDGHAMVRLDGKWGIINTDGDEILPCKYDRVWHFLYGRATVQLDGKVGHVDLKGNETWE